MTLRGKKVGGLRGGTMRSLCCAMTALTLIVTMMAARRMLGTRAHQKQSPMTGRQNSQFSTNSEQWRDTVLSPGDIDCALAGFPGKSISSERQYHAKNTSDEASCLSKYMQHCFWNARDQPPSPRFLSALRDYEALHERCVNSHNLTELLVAGRAPEGCKYLVWRNLDGMGNQLISLVSAFVYSLLTRRTLLISPEASFQHLLCEPFPRSSWLVPQEFPEDAMRQRAESQGDYFQRVDNLTRNAQGSINLDAAVEITPNRLFVGLSDFSPPPHHDRRFFCSTEQKLLDRVPWLLFRSNAYSIPGLYFVPEYRNALNRLFPDKAVFLHTARYLLSPANDVWGWVTRFHDAYLATADKKFGIQVRSWTPEYKPLMSDHIFQCAVATNILPNLTSDAIAIPNPQPQRITILMTALGAEYHHDLRDRYLRHANLAGHHITVISPSSEGHQQTGDLDHDKKAIADMWLLSFMDDIVSSPKSTFGYVAHGLAGITPIVFIRWGVGETLPAPPCERTNLPGPCHIDIPGDDEACPLDPPGPVTKPVPEVRGCIHQWGGGVFEG